MKLMVRAHDLGVKCEGNVALALKEKKLDGVQLVAYKCTEDVKYEQGSIKEERAKEIGSAIRDSGAEIPLIGAYFNCVHPNTEKTELGIAVFKDYLDVAEAIGCVDPDSAAAAYLMRSSVSISPAASM